MNLKKKQKEVLKMLQTILEKQKKNLKKLENGI